MPDPTPQVAHEFELGSRGTVRATVDEYRGKRFVSLRLWVEPRTSMGAELIPTAKGLTVPLEYVDDLVEAAQALLTVVQPGGRARG